MLVPEGFAAWPLLERYGLRRVDPVPFLRAHAAPLTLALLAHMGVPPQQACVALRGREVDRSMVQAAQVLCPQVREIAVSAAIFAGIDLVLCLIQLLAPDLLLPLLFPVALIQNWTAAPTSALYHLTGNLPVSALAACLAPFLCVPFGKRSL